MVPRRRRQPERPLAAGSDPQAPGEPGDARSRAEAVTRRLNSLHRKYGALDVGRFEPAPIPRLLYERRNSSTQFQRGIWSIRSKSAIVRTQKSLFSPNQKIPIERHLGGTRGRRVVEKNRDRSSNLAHSLAVVGRPRPCSTRQLRSSLARSTQATRWPHPQGESQPARIDPVNPRCVPP